jgi:hypothetical protein
MFFMREQGSTAASDGKSEKLLMEPLIGLLMKPLAIPLRHQKTVAKRLVIAGHPLDIIAALA